MADKKNSKGGGGGGENGHTLAFEVIGLIVIFFVVWGMISGTDFGKKINSSFTNNPEIPRLSNESIPANTSSKIVEGKPSFIGRFFPSGEISVGKKIMNKAHALVRSEPGGQVLGQQKLRTVGKVVAGPIDKFGKRWWRVDYPDAPDGWVYEGNFTKHLLTFGLFNIIPIAFGFLKPFLLFISIVFVVLILIIFLKMSDLRKLKKKKEEMLFEQNRLSQKGSEYESVSDAQIDDVELPNLPTGNDAPRTVDRGNRRWSNIQTLINSHSINDWKQAIIEADIILDEMLTKMGYKGDSIGDKLQKVERSDFLTLDKAWEAHKIRNRIAHKGSEYVLSRDEAEKAINMYKEVFSEFYYI